MRDAMESIWKLRRLVDTCGRRRPVPRARAPCIVLPLSSATTHDSTPSCACIVLPLSSAPVSKSLQIICNLPSFTPTRRHGLAAERRVERELQREHKTKNTLAASAQRNPPRAQAAPPLPLSMASCCCGSDAPWHPFIAPTAQHTARLWRPWHAPVQCGMVVRSLRSSTPCCSPRALSPSLKGVTGKRAAASHRRRRSRRRGWSR